MTRKSPRSPPPEIPGYADLRLLGVGGMASVYLAVQESLQRQVALKLLDGGDPSRHQRFLNESRIIASLNHRNVVTIHDVGMIDGRPYISMEYLRGGDLEHRLGLGPVAADEALDLVEAMAGCLDFVHRHGIIHRDVKPANILFHEDGTPILTDFGLAKQQASDSRLTIDGTTVGTPYYLSPEQAECKPLDGRTDVYGLGVILFEMLTGSKPYEGASAMGTILAHITDPIPSLPAELARYQPLLERMLAKDPAERFASAAELLEHLRALRARSASFGGPARASARRAMTAVRDVIGRAVRDPTAPPADVGLAGHGPADDGPTDAGMEPRSTANGRGRRLGGLPRRHAPRLGWRGRGAAAGALLLAVAVLGARVLTGPSASAPTAEPAAESIEPPSPAAEYMAMAERALRAEHLSRPREESALDYYERVLALEPGHEEALRGLAYIAERYADLAEAEMAQLRFPDARTFIARGLEVQPDHPRLQLLEEQARPINAVPQRIEGGVRSFFDRARRRGN